VSIKLESNATEKCKILLNGKQQSKLDFKPKFSHTVIHTLQKQSFVAEPQKPKPSSCTKETHIKEPVTKSYIIQTAKYKQY
jgi:hypothetical protein